MLVELRRAAVETLADAAVVGMPMPVLSPQFVAAAALAALPVLLTGPAPEPSAGGWLFSLGPTPAQIDRLVADDLSARGLQSSALRLDPRSADAISGPLQLGGARALVLAGSPKDFSRLPGVAKALASPPAAYLGYLTEPGDLGDFRDLPSVWPGSRHVVGGAPREQSAARRAFVDAYGQRRGPASTPAATAYDALTLIAEAVERGGPEPPSREGLRDALDRASSEGVASTYSFFGRRAGFRASDLALLRWSGSFVTEAR
ncbi:MAG: hypothetical protein FJ034_09240 [Chloroflexi bacterium]|nr:hypothetical protein [Chloroflexota bacterium]